MTYKTPGVYVEEISTLPPSVAEVSTAVPAFFGYTEKGPAIARINTLLEYEELFGGAPPVRHSVKVSGDPGSWTIESITPEAPVAEFLLHHSISHYFKNGGGSCYVASTGDYSSPPSKSAFEDVLSRLETEDEPTLLVLTDATLLESTDYYDLCVQALQQCHKLGDRFAVLDVKDGDVDGFRNLVGTEHLMYAAAYHPYLETTLNHRWVENDVSIWVPAVGSEVPGAWQYISNADGILVERETGDAPTVKIVAGNGSYNIAFVIDGQNLTITNVSGRTGLQVAAEWQGWIGESANNAEGFAVSIVGTGTAQVAHTSSSNKSLEPYQVQNLEVLKDSHTGLYNQIKAALGSERVILPPSAAMAGVYSSVDRDRGVWKAPANVSLSSVIGPVTKITHDEQERLNIDPAGGKSINALRAFSGKGTLVWGARTLAGNDNEWRYVSVRRLFNMIEESCRKATSFAVFEPNDMTTWLKVKGMIEGYLYTLWEKGALAGSTPETAYYVHVGLGKTMTAQDVLEGRMHVEIGIAAVRPAEFIVLRFSHKLQEA